VGKLGETAGGDVGGRPARAVKVYHTLSLLQGGEPLGAPFTGVVGGLVANFDFHGLGVG